MENKQIDSVTMAMEMMRDLDSRDSRISEPLQKLFDECMSYISISDFIVV